MRGDMEDGWGSGAGRVAASPLRHAAAQRATSPGFAGGGQGQSYTHQLMVRFVCGSAAGRTMGCEPKRIGVAFALELDGAELREAFDVVAEGDEGVDAPDELGERLWA